MADLPNDIPGLLIPMQGRPWLLPNIVVAEIIPLRQPERPGHGPEWLLGWINWRDEEIPLLSFEKLNDSGQVSIGQDARIAVINTVTGKLKFYAIIIQGIPRQSRVGNDDIVEEPVQSGPAEAMYVQMGGDLAVIPDLDAIERAIAGLMQ
ncbi:MAG: chemotaxis protein CheW [Alcanivoracaceae bacterium]|jgi:chemosensory pili system protein ChpC|nr:chemotaxis protein CheW [Alcanivoracaceae bacterium]